MPGGIFIPEINRKKSQMKSDNTCTLMRIIPKQRKYKQIACLPVDYKENGGIIESGKKLSELGKFEQKIHSDMRMRNIYEFYSDCMALRRIGHSDKIVELVSENSYQVGI